MASAEEQREIALVDKVHTRLALTEDEKLETVLKVYLPPLLLKLGSDHVAVRGKVISACQHIKLRLSANPDMVLPVAALLQQYKDQESPLIKHFDLLFVQQSLDKLSYAEKRDLIPTILRGFSKESRKPSCATLFNLFLRLLPLMKLPSKGTTEDDELRTKIGLGFDAKDAEFLADCITKLIQYPSYCVVNESLLLKDYDWNPKAPEGLNLTESKIAVLNLLGSGAFNDSERFIPSLYAAADADSKINSIGDHLLKRNPMSMSMDDRNILVKLFEIFRAALPPLRIRILSLLSKSKTATEFPGNICDLMLQAMGPPNASTPAPKGLEATKTRNALYSFMNFVSKTSSQKDLEHVASFTIKYLRTGFDEMGWPRPLDDSSSDIRARAYEVIGSMAKNVPSTFLDPDLELVRWLFRSLKEETSPSTIIISIEGALDSMLNALPNTLDPKLRSGLRELLLESMAGYNTNWVRSGARVTVRWANQCLEYGDVVARWIDLLAIASSESSDVAEEGNKGLDPYWCRISRKFGSSTFKVEMPDFEELVNVFFGSKPLLESSSLANSLQGGMDIDTASVMRNFSGNKEQAFPYAVAYCRRMLLVNALVEPASDADWERQIEVLLRTDKSSRQRIQAYMATMGSGLKLYFDAAFEGMIRSEGKGLGDCGKSFTDLAGLAPPVALGGVANRSTELLSAVFSNDMGARSTAAKAIGLILSAQSANETASTVALLAELNGKAAQYRADGAIGSDANKMHGALLAIGSIQCYSVFRGDHELATSIIDTSVSLILSTLVENRDKMTRDAAFVALGNLCAAGLVKPAFIPQAEGSDLDAKKLIVLLSDEALKGNETAISALGKLALIFDDDDSSESPSPLSFILESFYKLHELKQAEVQFTVGEALSVASAAWSSDYLRLSFDLDDTYQGKVVRKTTLSTLLDKLLQDCKKTKPSLKKASGIWLFSLIQYCGQTEEIQRKLRECQAAFMGLLSSRDDTVQETASRGLSLVYEQGDKELREKLVADLVQSFTGKAAPMAKVDAETELFDEGALPIGDNKSITTYGSVLSLASELGDSSLVYKFMSLASSASTWKTRAAMGRFGLSKILSDTSVDPKIYPALYRYTHDPNPQVRASMVDIWSALVKSPSATIREHYDALMKDAIEHVLTKEWRTREASCAAIADLVHGARFEQYEQYLGQLLDVSFKVLDDIKGSVRKAAEKLCQVLTGILIRQLEAGESSKHASAMLEEVLPFLFSTRGLESPSKDVQHFAYETVIKLTKSGSKSLLPHVPLLIEQILGLISTLEPDYVNYLSMNATRYGYTSEKVDEARSSAVAHSPLFEAVERCLDLLDEDAMKALVPHLQNVIKTAVGMPSKVGCAGVLVNLATRHSFVCRSRAGVFLKDIEKAVLDRNTTVSAAYARSAGYLARLATDDQILKLAAFAQNQYFTAEDESRRQIAAEIIYFVSKFATDRFTALAAEFLPFVFFAKHDFDEQVKEYCTKTWDDNVGGSRAVLMYLKEIIEISQERLTSPKWTIKHTAALAIADVVKSSAANELSVSNAKIIWPALEASLALKTFDGKEQVVIAFVKFTEAGKAFWSSDEKISAQMTKIAIREAKRQNAVYRPHALLGLGTYVTARADVNLFESVLAVMKPQVEAINEAASEDAMDVDGEEGKIWNTKTINAALEALLRAATAHPSVSQLAALLETVQAFLKSQKFDISTKVVFYERSEAYFKALTKTEDKSSTLATGRDAYGLAKTYFELLEVSEGAGSEVARTKRAEAANAVVDAVKSGCLGHATEQQQKFINAARGQLAKALDEERSKGVKRVLETALEKMESRAR